PVIWVTTSAGIDGRNLWLGLAGLGSACHLGIHCRRKNLLSRDERHPSSSLGDSFQSSIRTPFGQSIRIPLGHPYGLPSVEGAFHQFDLLAGTCRNTHRVAWPVGVG